MRTNEIFESLLSQYGLDSIRVINGITHKRWQDSIMDDARHRLHDIIRKHLIEEASKGKVIMLSIIL